MKKIINLGIFLLALVLRSDGMFAIVFIDTSFGNNGMSVITQSTQTATSKVTVMGDGKIVTCGICTQAGNNGIFVARFTANGLPDTSFNETGRVILMYGTNLWGTALTVQSDGKILVGGGTVIDGVTQFFIARYTTNGLLDESFGSSGILTRSLGANASARALAMQTVDESEYILVAGQGLNNGMSGLFVSRYKLDGTLDQTFGSEGTIQEQIGSSLEPAVLAIQSDNKIVVGGSAYIDNRVMLLMRYTSSGVRDSTFGTQGVVLTAVPGSVDDSITDLQVNADGTIIVVGRSQLDGLGALLLARFLATGELDLAFGSSGITTTVFDSDATGASIYRMVDGTYIVSANVNEVGTLLRYTSAGLQDPSFGSSGILTTSISGALTMPVACLDNAARVIIGGSFDSNAAVARYHLSTSDFIAIDSPVASSTQTGTFTINGRASRANMSVRIKTDTTIIATVTSDANGNWSAGTSPVLANGSRSIIADLMDGQTVIATVTNTITMSAADSVVITAPVSGATVDTYTPLITGTSTRAAASMRVKIDGAVIATVTTNSLGGWQITSARLNNGSHTILAELIDGESVVAGATRLFTVSVASWPGQTDCSNLRIVSGSFTVATPPSIISGSGAQCPPNCTFSVTRIRPNRYRIDFLPAFFYTPTVTATAKKSGDSDVSVAVQNSATLSSVTIDVDSRTDEVYFLAMSCRG